MVVALKTTVGQYASALKPVFTLMDDDRWYVIANFRETDLKNVRPGVAARVTIMTNHDKSFAGVVDSVGSGVLPEGGSVIEGLPIIQKSINWVHVSQRFPVKIAVKDPDPELFRMAPLPAPFFSLSKEALCRTSGHFCTGELATRRGEQTHPALTLSCAVLIVLFMTLQIPFLAVALIVVFYVSQPNVLMIKAGKRGLSW